MTDKEWAQLRLTDTEKKLAIAENDERYSGWYVAYLRTRVMFYSEMLKC